MDPDKRLSKMDIRSLIVQACGAPQTREVLISVFEQLMECEFNVNDEQFTTLETLRAKIDELNEASTSDEMLVFANSFADIINHIDSANGLGSLPDATVEGCEFLVNHLEVMITRDAPTFDLVDVKRAHSVLTAHAQRPAWTDHRSPTDRVPGNDRGFNRGEIAHAI